MKEFNTVIAAWLTSIGHVEWSCRNFVKAIAGVLLGALLLFFAGFDVAIAAIIDVNSDDEAALVFGIVFSQITLLAIWSALAPVGFVARFGSGLGIASLISLALLLSIRREQDSYLALSLAAVTIAMWLATQIPIGMMRFAGGWRLGLSGRAITNDRSTQFGLWQLLVWTSAVGVWLGIARLAVPTESGNGNAGDLRFAIVLFLLLLVFHSLSALPIVWAALTPRFVLLWLIVAVICYVVISLAEAAAFHSASGRNGGDGIFWVINAIQFAGAFVPLLLLRLCGVRLVRDGGLGST